MERPPLSRPFSVIPHRAIRHEEALVQEESMEKRMRRSFGMVMLCSTRLVPERIDPPTLMPFDAVVLSTINLQFVAPRGEITSAPVIDVEPFACMLTASESNGWRLRSPVTDTLLST